MKKAIVVDGVIREIVPDDTEFYKDILFDVADDAMPGWTLRDGESLPPVPPEITWEDRRRDASFLLMSTDRIIVRMYEESMNIPPEWVEWRRALRGIVAAETGDATAGLPEQPKEPEWP